MSSTSSVSKLSIHTVLCCCLLATVSAQFNYRPLASVRYPSRNVYSNRVSPVANSYPTRPVGVVYPNRFGPSFMSNARNPYVIVPVRAFDSPLMVPAQPPRYYNPSLTNPFGTLLRPRPAYRQNLRPSLFASTTLPSPATLSNNNVSTTSTMPVAAANVTATTPSPVVITSAPQQAGLSTVYGQPTTNSTPTTSVTNGSTSGSELPLINGTTPTQASSYSSSATLEPASSTAAPVSSNFSPQPSSSSTSNVDAPADSGSSSTTPAGSSADQ